MGAAGAAFFAAFLAAGFLEPGFFAAAAFFAGAAFFAAAFFAGAAFLAGAAFFAVAITISLIKLQKTPRHVWQRGDSSPGGLPKGLRPLAVAPVR